MMNLLLIVCSVTQMALDQICVVTPSNPRQCQNQDVLFLGTGMPYTSYPKTNNKRSDQEMCIPSRIFSFCMSVTTNNIMEYRACSLAVSHDNYMYVHRQFVTLYPPITILSQVGKFGSRFTECLTI